MKLKSKITSVVLAALISAMMCASVLAQDATDNSNVDVQVYSGVFNVTADVGAFNAVQPGETSNGSLSIIVEDERATGTPWHVEAKAGAFKGLNATPAQTFYSPLKWTPDPATPSGVVNFSNGTMAIDGGGNRVMSTTTANRGIVSASGPVTVDIPIEDVDRQPLQGDTYRATITVSLFADDPAG